MQAETENNLVHAKSAFLARLRQFVEETQILQAQGADAMGVTDNTFQNYLYGNTSPPVEKLVSLAQKFGYSPKWFFQVEPEISLENVRDAVIYVERALDGKDLDAPKKAQAIALTARALARERETDRVGDFEQKIMAHILETISLLR